MNNDNKPVKNKKDKNSESLTNEELADIITDSAIYVFLSNSEKGLYEPLETPRYGNTYINFMGFMGAYSPKNSSKENLPDLLIDFATETNKKLGVHPIYLLKRLGIETQATKKTLYELKKESDITYIQDLSESLNQCNAILYAIPEAFRKLSSKPLKYII